MKSKPSKHLKNLIKLAGQRDISDILYPCIEDLVQNGLRPERFAEQELTPTRQDVTQYLLTWLKSNGFSADQCREWVLEYCMDRLAFLSDSPLSKIRHSTKSNIKYIFRADIEFQCDCKFNPFRAKCSATCPVHREMYAKYKERKQAEANQTYEVEPLPQVDPDEFEYRPSVKEKYKEQYQKSLRQMEELFAQGMPIKDIVEYLNEKKLYSRTGIKWTYANLRLDASQRGFIKKKNRGVGRVKERYRQQYEEALEIIRRERQKNVSAPQIVDLLNSRGFKSSTGAKWTTGILWNAIRKMG